MGMSYGCTHELVVHDLVASVAGTNGEVEVVDDNVIELVDNSIHFDYANHPKLKINENVSKSKTKNLNFYFKKNTNRGVPLIRWHISIVCISVAWNHRSIVLRFRWRYWFEWHISILPRRMMML